MAVRGMQFSLVVLNCSCRAYRRPSPWHGPEVGKAEKTTGRETRRNCHAGSTISASFNRVAVFRIAADDDFVVRTEVTRLRRDSEPRSFGLQAEHLPDCLNECSALHLCPLGIIRLADLHGVFFSGTGA